MKPDRLVDKALINCDIRRLWTSEKPILIDHFGRLDAQTRRLRFGAAVSGECAADYADSVLSLDALVYGAFVDGTLRGVGELRRLSSRWPARAELALSVEPAWQAEGIGDALFARIVAAAQNRGVGTLFMLCLRENEPMQNLARKHDAVLSFDIDEVEATLDPPWPTPLSLVEEMMGETRSYLHAVLRLRP